MKKPRPVTYAASFRLTADAVEQLDCLKLIHGSQVAAIHAAIASAYEAASDSVRAIRAIKKSEAALKGSSR